jgi:phasin family protein
MSAIPEQVLARQKATVETLVAAHSAMFAGFEKLVDLNLKVMKATFDELSLTSQQAATLRDPQEATAWLSSFAQPSAEKALAYGKHVYDIVASVQGELSKLGESQVAEGQKQLLDAVDELAKNAPAGSESALAMLKNTLATANSAYDSVNKAARQAAQAAESNINAATNATFKAASDAAEAANKAAGRTRRATPA